MKMTSSYSFLLAKVQTKDIQLMKVEKDQTSHDQRLHAVHDVFGLRCMEQYNRP